MSKVFNYVIVTFGLILLMGISGILTGAAASLGWFGITINADGTYNTSDLSAGAFYLAIAAILGVSTVGGIVIGYFTKSSSESYIAAAFSLALFITVTSIFMAVINYTKDMGYIFFLTVLILLPLWAGFGISIIQFWRGVD